MRSGIRWLIAGLAGATLALPSITLAAPAPAARGNQGGGAGSPNSLGETGQPGTARPTTGPTGTSQQGSFMPPPPIRPGQTMSVLVFPFGFTSDSESGVKPPAPGSAVQGVPESPATGLSANQQQVSDYLTGIVKAGFLATPAYTLMTYYPQSSLVARALKDNILTNAQTLEVVSPTTGAADVDRARLVTNRLGIQALLVGTMEMKATPKTNTVEITLETQLINSATGEVLRSAAVSGAAAGADGVALQTVQERAALETAQKVLPAMGIQLVTPRPAVESAPTSKGKSKSSKRAKASSAPKSQPKANSTKAEQKAADEARKQQEREAEAARKEQARAAAKARDAEKEAKKAAEKAARDAKRQAEKEREQAKRSASKKPAVKEAAVPAASTPAVDARPTTIPAAQTAPPPAAPAPSVAAPTATPSGTAVPGTVTARADATGYPVPYGYAMENNLQKLPSRDRTKLRVPAWLGVAGFLTGLSFLL